MDDWYVISNVDRIDSPALAFYPDRISGNIELAKRIKSWIIAGRVAYIPFILIMIHSKGK